MALEYTLHLMEKVDPQHLLKLAGARAEIAIHDDGVAHTVLPYEGDTFKTDAWIVKHPLAPPSERAYLDTLGAIPQTQLSFRTAWINAQQARTALLKIVLRILEVVEGDAFLMYITLEDMLLSRRGDQLTFKWGYWSLDELTTLKLHDAALEKQK
jgi:hypothetical protein